MASRARAEYAQVLRMLGNGRLEAQCFDGKVRLGHIRGKMRKKVWVSQGDIVLVALRDFQDDKCDIIAKFSADEARQLKTIGELPEKSASQPSLRALWPCADRAAPAAKINEVDLVGEEGEEDDACAFDFDEVRGMRRGGARALLRLTIRPALVDLSWACAPPPPAPPPTPPRPAPLCLPYVALASASCGAAALLPCLSSCVTG